ncbi:unnamed protein product [Cyclocybe aegerita]|uniref:DNA polymerase n=1 Tax=Cyclocybe aegerita TaxID=1973307 RepID=A0A8S0VYZ6_CYCAE|nr:unnamed protein product [Cyclocybe aegerita]
MRLLPSDHVLDTQTHGRLNYPTLFTTSSLHGKPMLGRHLFAKRCISPRPRQFTYVRFRSSPANQHNQAIVDLLEKCKEEEEQALEPNNFKILAFRNAIQTVRAVEKPIQIGHDILELKGIGPGIMSRINEYLYANEAFDGQVDSSVHEEIAKTRALTMLRDVPGIGLTTAKKLIAAGCYSIADLKERDFSSVLTPRQAAKVKYMGHLEHPIERKDAEDVLSFIRESLDPAYDAVLVGDYRRGASSFPDIQIMISHPDFVHIPLPTDPSPFSELQPPETKRPRRRTKKEERQNMLHAHVVPLLQKRALIAETLGTDVRSWDGIVWLPEEQGGWGTRQQRLAAIEGVDGRFRRMSIKFVPQKSQGSSLLVLTGDSAFEKDLCYRAKQLGMLFNEYGLWKWNSSDLGDASESNGSNNYNFGAETEDALDKGYWSLSKSATEEDIFAELGMDPVDPTSRNFSFLSSKLRKKRTIHR